MEQTKSVVCIWHGHVIHLILKHKMKFQLGSFRWNYVGKSYKISFAEYGDDAFTIVHEKNKAL